MENQLNLITTEQLLGSIAGRVHVLCFLINSQAFKVPAFYKLSLPRPPSPTVYVKLYVCEAIRSKH